MRTLSREQVRAVDRLAIDEYGLAGIVLMENAGRGAADWLSELGVHGTVVICVGKGNNGGDGLVMARHLDLWKIPVFLLVACHPDDFTGDAKIQFDLIRKTPIPLSFWKSEQDSAGQWGDQLVAADWIVDALLGTGSRGNPRGPVARCIELIGCANRRVFAVDLPSGLDCDTGMPSVPCVRATATATFVAQKQGFVNPVAQSWLGAVRVIDIGIPRCLKERVLDSIELPSNQ